MTDAKLGKEVNSIIKALQHRVCGVLGVTEIKTKDGMYIVTVARVEKETP